MLLECRRSHSFTYRVADAASTLPRPAMVQMIPPSIVPVYPRAMSNPQGLGRSTPLITSFRSYPAIPYATRRRQLHTLDTHTPTPMTRLIITPQRVGGGGGSSDIRPKTSINRSVSTSSIPSSHSYNKGNIMSPLSTTNTTSSSSLHHHYPHHHYLQHHPKLISSSTSNIAAAGRQSPGHMGSNVSRSHSFGGISAAGNTWPSASGAVLGETMRRNQRGYRKIQTRLFSFRRSPRLSKVPNTRRAMMVFDSVKKGLGEFIQAAHEDIGQLITSENGTSTAQGRLFETDKKIKSAERYLKRLECHLAKVDELHDLYLLNQQLREGAINMAKAFNATGSHNRKDSISNIKYGYKECSQAMCAVESQLDNLLGTFSCRLHGIAGFARVVPGDVYEVLIKHGSQKWKTKGRIEKDGNQKWDTPDHSFKCLVGDVLSIKVSEVKVFKSVVLGQKSCEIWNPTMNDAASQGLFCARPQLMTVSINVQGSLKLSIVITWNPLDGVDESVKYVQSPIHSVGLPLRKRPVSIVSLAESSSSSNSSLTVRPDGRFVSPLRDFKHRDDSGIYGSATSLPSHLTIDSGHFYHTLPVSPLTHDHKNIFRPDSSTSRLRPYSISTFDVRHAGSRQLEPASPTAELPNLSSPHADFNLQKQLTLPPLTMVQEVTQTMVPGLEMHRMLSLSNSDITLEQALLSLKTTLEDFLGQYPELQKLEDGVQMIEAFIKKSSVSRMSSMNASIEGEIEEAFDFLNMEGILEDVEEENEKNQDKQMLDNMAHVNKTIVSPSSTAKTADSGIESLAKRLQEDITFGSSVGSSPLPPTTGSEQLDQALVFHLTLCDKLLQNLGNFGPLRCREFYALDHLQKQAQVLESLMAVAKAGSDLDLKTVLSKETSDKMVTEVWQLCLDQTPMFTQMEKVVSTLERKFAEKLSEKYKVKPNRVFQQIMARMLYATTYESEFGSSSIITFHQFMLFFKGEDMFVKIRKIADEFYLLDLLNATTSDTVIQAIVALRDDLPPPICLKMLTKLLLGSNRETQQAARTYLKIISREKSQRDMAMVVLVEGLEDHIAEVRAGCCVALSIFEAEECISQLVHLSQADSSSVVRRKAKESLYSLGDIGRKALEEIQLSSQGFQGLQMHKPCFSKII